MENQENLISNLIERFKLLDPSVQEKIVERLQENTVIYENSS